MTSSNPATDSASAPADQFTAARIAAVLGRDARSVREALASRDADGTCVVAGNVAKTYLYSSLPERLRSALADLANARGFDTVERLLSRDESRWAPALPVAEIHPREITRATKRAAALSDEVRAYSEGSKAVAAIQASCVAAHREMVGYELSASAIDALIRRAINRDGGRGEFHRWELFLPENPKRLRPAPGTVAEDAFEHVELYLDVVKVEAPTLVDRAWVWTAMCENLQQLLQAGELLRPARRRLVTYVFKRAPWLCSSRESLSKCFAEKWERYADGERFVGDRRPDQSGNHQTLPLTDEDQKELVARALCGGVAKAWRDALRAGALSPGVMQYSISNPSSKSYVPDRVREIIGPQVELLQDIHHGPRQAELNGAYITRDWSKVSPGDLYQSDDCTLPIYYWENGPDGKPRAIRGQWLPMIDCKTTLVLEFALHSDRNYNAKVIRGLILRTHDGFGLPRVAFYFEKGIWKKAKLLKGVRGDEIPGEETERGLRDYVQFVHANLPRGKVIEGILGILQREMEDQPGYVGRDEKTERFERVQKKLLLAARGAIEYSSFLLHRDEWVERLVTVCQTYNAERQDGRLKGLSPQEAWDSEFDFDRPLTRLDGPARRLLANHRRPLRVGKNGLCIEIGRERHWFRSEDTGRIIGEIVQAYFNPEELGSIWIERKSGEIIVVPRAPGAPAIGATAEELAAAKASCAAHNAPAITLYREVAKHFPKNGPSPFRTTVVSPEFAQDSADIADQQAAIHEGEIEAEKRQKKLGRLRRTHGRIVGSGPVSNERLMAAYDLINQAEKNDNP